jgi:hypothetical protein
MAIQRRRRDADALPEAKPKNDAYTGILGISLGAMIIGCVFLYLDYSQYGDRKAPAPPPPEKLTVGSDKQPAPPPPPPQPPPPAEPMPK